MQFIAQKTSEKQSDFISFSFDTKLVRIDLLGTEKFISNQQFSNLSNWAEFQLQFILPYYSFRISVFLPALCFSTLRSLI